jgi:hypothetical protein
VAGASLNESFAFAKGPTYSIVFSRSGLPKGETWCVMLEGWTRCTGQGSVRYANLMNGTYSYGVRSMPGQSIFASLRGTALPLTGNLTLTSKGLTVALKYVYPYAVTFVESGLPSGTSWSVTLKGNTHTSSTSTIAFSEPNGTYGFKIGSETGYVHVAVPAGAKVKGAPVTITVTFKEKPGPAAQNPSRIRAVRTDESGT